MNKKLLLILSILMSLSLLTMSCAKSVAAPDTPTTGISVGQTLDSKTLEAILKRQGVISIPKYTQFGGNSGTFDFSQGTLSDTSFIVSCTPDGSSYGTVYANTDYVLGELKYTFNGESGYITFSVADSWDTIPSGNFPAYIDVTLTSSAYTIPDSLKTITIYLSGVNWITTTTTQP